jgi:hypothetical protein
MHNRLDYMLNGETREKYSLSILKGLRHEIDIFVEEQLN